VTETFLFQAFVYLLAAVVAVLLAQRAGLGAILGYLIAGVVIGPFGLGLIGEEGQDVLHVAEFGVVLLLFVVGLELEPSRLWRLRGPILGLGSLQVVVTSFTIAGIALLLGLPWQSALAIGMTLSLSSTVIALQLLREKGVLNTAGGQSSFAVLLFQDIAVIPMLALFPLLAVAGAHGAGTGDDHGGMTLIASLPGWAQTVVMLAAVGAVVVIGRFLASPIFRAIARTRLRELFTAAALLLLVGIALLMQAVGLSSALGAFLAGVVLANSEYRHELESDIDPFKGLLLGLFFIAVGTTINVNLIAAQPVTVAAVVALIVFVKIVILFALARAFKLGIDQSMLAAVTLAQVGEFAFVLLAFSSREGILSSDVTAILVAAVALTMALTPLLALLNERLLLPRLGTRERQEREADAFDERKPVIIAGFGRFGSIVGRLLTANGVETVVLDNDSDRVDILRRLGLRVYYGDASRLDLLRAAGAEHARLIVLALDSPEKTLEMVRTIKQHFPHLTIMARAYDRADAFDLIDEGVHSIYRETFDTALRMGVDAMRLLGFRAYQATRAANTFRIHDDRALYELLEVRKDQTLFISAARKRIADLEALLRTDIEDRGLERDSGWDTETLRAEMSGAPPPSS
jgi:monovalent cation:proton antiporter-2 (CPA2) family protein